MQTQASDNWNEHWDAYARSAALNPAQSWRRELAFRLLDLGAAPAPVRLIELGCGTGDFAHEVQRRHPQTEYLGLDRSESGVALARSSGWGEFHVRDLEQPLDLPEDRKGWATHVVCCEVLEHVDDPARVLANVRPYVAPGGRVVLTVPGGPRSEFDLHIGHRRHFTPASLRGLIEQAGFSAESVWGAGFPFFNLYRLAVILRGQRLIDDARSENFSSGLLQRAAARTFSVLFSGSLVRGERGWQMLAIARA